MTYDELHRRLIRLKRSPKLDGIFSLYSEETIDTLKSTTRIKHQKLWLSHFASIGNLRADKINPLEIQRLILQEGFTQGHYHSVCSLARFAVQLLDFAQAVGIIAINPLRNLFDLPLVRRARIEESKRLVHRPTLDFHHLRQELKEVISTFERECCRRQQLLFEVQLRTILRPGEAVKLKIDALDLERHLLTAKETKTKEVFIIPTFPSLESALREAHADYGSAERGWVFAGLRDPNQHLSPQTLNKALKDHGYKDKLTAHGLRSVAANFFARNNGKVPPYVAEACLQHTCHNAAVVKAYRRDDYLHARKQAMKLYNEWLDGIYAQVRGAR